jgi:glycerol-3-phosphate acyltransferase PlsX
VALLSIGEEPSKGNPLVREAHARLASLETMTGSGGRFVGNVEGRHLLSSVADVVVTDGFTGNVVLKTLEGGVKFTLDAVRSAVAASPEGRQASQALLSALAPLVTQLDPDSYGGAVLLGVDGVCVISHGSSSSRAIVNAVGVARAAVADDLVGRLRQAVAGASFTSAQAST